ncbi:hypothetical protein B4U79_17279 [Dinothrombium tinctorium]|uniref:BTB domain-containing protein n=1 Tax=Dinothrombium tinctorium TaxID=1965070 RepID=A0A443RH48_9ACAR|nr:hypothetical protein B4U79_17279 [Dinothrombium tinctorium]
MSLIDGDCVTIKLEHQFEFMHTYREMYKLGVLFDAIFTSSIEDGENWCNSEANSIKAHRKVLSAYSLYFANLFENQSNAELSFIILVVKPDDFNYLKAIIDAIYGKMISIEKHNLITFTQYVVSLGIESMIKALGVHNFSELLSGCSSNGEIIDDQTLAQGCASVSRDLNACSQSTVTQNICIANETSEKVLMASEEGDNSENSRSSLVTGSDIDVEEWDDKINWRTMLKNVFFGIFQKSKTEFETKQRNDASKVNCRPKHHKNSKRFKCNFCEKTCGTKPALNMHIKFIHQNKKFKIKNSRRKLSAR